MSHITIIISKAAPAGAADSVEALTPSYEYRLPVPHNTTPAKVAEMVRRAYRHLQMADTDSELEG